MADPTEPPREHPSTYFVQDRSNLDEMARVEIQDKMITAGMGGVLPELEDVQHLRHVLDVGCGTGDWLMETARTYPHIEKLCGVDISGKMMDYARAQAERLGLGGRVQFETMDVLRILDFPDAHFDLVNHRLGISWIRHWEWTKLLLEYQRVTRPGGIIRITESNIAESNSEALSKLCKLVIETCYTSGRFFDHGPDGITDKLFFLMTQHGIEEVQTQDHTLVFRAGTQEHRSFCEDMNHLFRVSLPFFQRWTHVPSDYWEIYEQALTEMQQPDFVATWRFLTAWGIRPDGPIPIMRLIIRLFLSRRTEQWHNRQAATARDS